MLENFKLNSFIDVVNEFVRADEVTRALWLCDNLPAYYRDHTPKEILDLRREIESRIATPKFYSTGDFDCQIDAENKMGMEKSLRGHLVSKDVKDLNDKGLTPHIVDYGPGEYWLPIVLKHQELKFTYDAIYLNEKAFQKASRYFHEHLSNGFKDRPVIFVACEIIEHVWHEEELKTEMLRNCDLADIVHVSTPKYTFDNRDIDWREKKDLGHLRAYTPNEFYAVTKKMFHEYHQFCFDSVILHARFVKKDNLYNISLKHEL